MADILMINLPYAGHTNPTLCLARELVKKGYTIEYINEPEWRGKIEETGATFIPYLDYPEDLSSEQKKSLSIGAAFKTALSQKNKYKILIYEMLFFLGKTLAERLDIPYIRQFSQPAWNYESMMHMKKMNRFFNLSAKIINKKMLPKSISKELDVEGSSLITSVLNDSPELNIVYLPEELQPYRETFDKSYFFVGSSAKKPASSDVEIPFFDMKNPIIYISMGSIMSSKIFCHRVIKAFGNKDMNIILSTGRVNPKSLGEIPKNIYAYSFVPQMEVLEKADLFITHGGMNSVCEAINCETPMLVLPVINDQPINAAQIEKLKIGKKIRAFPTTANILYQNAIEVLENKNIKENILTVQKKVLLNKSMNEVLNRIEKIIFN